MDQLSIQPTTTQKKGLLIELDGFELDTILEELDLSQKPTPRKSQVSCIPLTSKESAKYEVEIRVAKLIPTHPHTEQPMSSITDIIAPNIYSP